uniref:Marginal zone B- and B1-cell-specific protein-like n=1 Tax=Phallusia mammillata TaxID=59560 RepID=A0A6F9DM07_9ASCI|nr:marginal zone B- and B1-cell-specific protein-like [Phallusia mammillata]
MERKCLMSAVLLLYCWTCSGQMGKPSVSSNDGTSGSISFGPPDLSDEETQANYMPTNLRCDACKAIASRFSTTLQGVIDKYKSVKEGKKDLSEDRILELFETICSDKDWSSYGIKEIDGVKHLAYPGSDYADVPGIMQGGGPWPRRLSDMCYAYIEKHDEYKIYRMQKKENSSGVYKMMCSTVCKTKHSSPKKKQKNEL